MATLLSLLIAITSALVYTSLLWHVDRYEHEPLWAWWGVFLWGAAPAAILALLLEHGANTSFLRPLFSAQQWDLFEANTVAPLVEEGVKGLALLLLFLCSCQEMDTPLDGLVYGALVGFGFSTTENFLYFLSAFRRGGWGDWLTLVAMRQFVFGLNHAFFTSFTGIGLVLGRRFRHRLERWLVALGGFALAILAHGWHNTAATFASRQLSFLFVAWGSDYLGVFFLLLLIGLMWRQERRIIKRQLATEVGISLDQSHYNEIINFATRFRRQKRRPRVLRRLYQCLYTEAASLAFMRERIVRRPDKAAHFQHKLVVSRKQLDHCLHEIEKIENANITTA